MNLLWDITSKCNLNCKYCGPSELVNNAPEDVEIWEDVIKYTDPFINSVTLLGGEPLLHPHIDKIIEKLKLNNKKVHLVTNGQVDNSLLEKISKLNIDTIFISIEGTEKINDEIRGKNSWKKAINSLKYLLKLKSHNDYKTEIGVTMVLNALNQNDIINFIENTKHLNISYNINPLFLEGNAKNNEEILNIDEKSALNAYERIFQYKLKNPDLKIDCAYLSPLTSEYLNKKYGLTLPIKGLYCSTLIELMYADSCGYISPCRKSKIKINVRDSINLESDFKKFTPLWKALKQKRNQACSPCKYEDLCNPCPLNKSFSIPKICLESKNRLENLSLPLKSKFEIVKPYILNSLEDNIFEIYFPKIGEQGQYTIEAKKIFDAIEIPKTLEDIAKETDIPINIVFEFLYQQKNLSRVLEKNKLF